MHDKFVYKIIIFSIIAVIVAEVSHFDMIWLDFVVVYDPQDFRSKSLKYFTNSTPFSNVGITLLHLLLKMYFLNSSMQVFIHSSS